MFPIRLDTPTCSRERQIARGMSVLQQTTYAVFVKSPRLFAELLTLSQGVGEAAFRAGVIARQEPYLPDNSSVPDSLKGLREAMQEYAAALEITAEKTEFLAQAKDLKALSNSWAELAKTVEPLEIKAREVTAAAGHTVGRSLNAPGHQATIGG